jgi:hypothetical protein
MFISELFLYVRLGFKNKLNGIFDSSLKLMKWLVLNYETTRIVSFVLEINFVFCLQ